MPKFSRCLAASVSLCALLTGFAGGAQANHVTGATAQQRQTVPIQLGTSGSSIEHIVSRNRLYCYAGTLGALVTDGTDWFVLSNNHVLAKENGNLNLGGGHDGEIIQPGLLDEGQCSLNLGNPGDIVANLTDYVAIGFGKGKTLPDNQVDAAIAAIEPNLFSTNGQVPKGAILGIGPLGGVAAALPEMHVQKTGRTTGHTFGQVVATDVSIDVKYDSGTARFVQQLRILSVCDGEKFSDAGDSGSLIASVPDGGGDPEAVGLLFAGGDTDTFANPIGQVLTELAASGVNGPQAPLTMVAPGGTTPPEATNTGYDDAATHCGSGGGKRPGGGRPFDHVDPVGLSIASDVKARHSKAIFALPDVVGHGIAVDADGAPVIEIYLAGKAKRAANRALPTEIEGIPVRVVETGRVRAF